MPLTTSPTSRRITENTHEVEVGDIVPISWFTQTSSGPTVDDNGDYMDDWNEVADREKWYERIQNTESLTASSNYYRKTFLAGVGGHFVDDGSVVYAITSQTYSGWGSISTPTPVPDEGWEFVRWINLSTGATVSNPSFGDTSSRNSTKYVAIFRKL